MDREPQPEDSTRVQITRAVFNGLEFIKRSGATNMLDRPTVLTLARQWDFLETADWIEQTDIGTYGRLILEGAEVVEDDRADQQIAHELENPYIEFTPSVAGDKHEATDETDDIDLTEIALDHVRGVMQEILSNLGKHAILTIAETYETQRMGVMSNPSRNQLITAERHALIKNLGHASSLWLQLEEAMNEVERGIGSLHYLVDPENN